ncbi:hypothetical protein LV564_00800 (plasmid) [Komagataeibacter nataicola]|uniref:hypothetical protein n=1 Tax=Komagataeibacter nataicola TaxID=265960 RepID=UPI0023DD3EB4|nr:hypothetical protein [Komagataeibacter nataicola]WEQ54261.1 hypothetical protein LV564_00800 [Komagataeibacter nataicola]
MQNNNFTNILFTIFVTASLCGCVVPEPPKIPFNSSEVSWAQKTGSSTIKGCVSGAEFTAFDTYHLADGTYSSSPVMSSSVEIPQKNFTIDLLPESDYMHVLAKKMHIYSLRLNDYTILNDHRWVDPSVLPFIPHFSCPSAGPNICTSPGHFIFSNLPAGNWYIVASYNPTKEDKTAGVTVHKITTIDGKMVPFISWVGARNKICKP